MLYLEPTVRGEGHLNWKEERDEGRGRKREEEGGREREREGEREGREEGGHEERKMHVARCVYTEHAYRDTAYLMYL